MVLDIWHIFCVAKYIMILYSSYRHNFYIEYEGHTCNDIDHVVNITHIDEIHDTIHTSIKVSYWWHDLNLTMPEIRYVPKPKLSLTMRIVAIESGFLLDSILHKLLNF
jgi:hypothetical protein